MSSATASSKFPPQIKYIVGNEACERYSYYGMRSILVIFMIQYLMMDRADATSVYHLFAASCYLLPVLGAYISDRFLGKYKTILYLSLIYCLGHLVLALFETKMGLYWGLGLIALGSGGIKPCVSAHVGDQFKKGEEKLLKRVFDLFYFMINFGSFFASLITPWMLPVFGPGVAFGIPGVLMAIATVLFWLGKKDYTIIPPTGKVAHGTGAILMTSFKSFFKGENKLVENGDFYSRALSRHPASAIDGVRSAFSVGKLFLTISIFWALFDQHGSTWVIQAKEMDLHFLGFELLPSQIQALNPIMVMVLIPLFSFWLYPSIEKLGIKLTPLRKMGAGMAVAGFAFVQVAMIQFFLDQGVKLNVTWQFFPYLTITIAEVLISVTGLEFAYTQAPRTMKSTIMSMWLLSVFLGNIITAYIAKVNVFEGPTFFLIFALMMALVTFVFAYMAKNYQMKDYMEKEDEAISESCPLDHFEDTFERNKKERGDKNRELSMYQARKNIVEGSKDRPTL